MMENNDFNQSLAKEIDKWSKTSKEFLNVKNHERIKQLIKLLSTETSELRGKQNRKLQLSASAVVFMENKMFFINHPYQHEWLLPAGHVELGEIPLETAIREFHEETGQWCENKGTLIDVNLIDIPYNPVKKEVAHQHIDFRFLLNLKAKKEEQAELTVELFSKEMAPKEFQKYFRYMK